MRLPLTDHDGVLNTVFISSPKLTVSWFKHVRAGWISTSTYRKCAHQWLWWTCQCPPLAPSAHPRVRIGVLYTIPCVHNVGYTFTPALILANILSNMNILAFASRVTLPLMISRKHLEQQLRCYETFRYCKICNSPVALLWSGMYRNGMTNRSGDGANRTSNMST